VLAALASGVDSPCFAAAPSVLGVDASSRAESR
jgi:hypothetical protein